MKRIITLTAITLCFLLPAAAQVDTINVATNKLLLNRLTEGTNTYAVYVQDSITNEIGFSDIWIRSIAFGERDGEPVVNFNWKWYRHDSIYRDVHDVNLRKNLKPVYTHTVLKGASTYAYNFTDSFMIAADTVAMNKADAKKKVLLSAPVYNWEWDMEIFPLLNIKKVGQKFAIAFLDPFGTKADYYRHDVIGTDDLVLNKAASVKCWILRVAYDVTSYADFWISQKTNEVLKMKGYSKGKYRYKVKLF